MHLCDKCTVKCIKSSSFRTGLTFLNIPYFLLAGMLRTRSVHLTGHKRGETLQKRDRSGAKIGLNFCLTPLPTNALIVVCGLFGIGCLDSFKRTPMLVLENLPLRHEAGGFIGGGVFIEFTRQYLDQPPSPPLHLTHTLSNEHLYNCTI